MRKSRAYYRSSSFKMALLFTCLLSAAVLSLGYFLYDSGREGYQRDSEAALDTEISSIQLEAKLTGEGSLEGIIQRRSGEGRGIHYLLTDLAGNWKAGDIKGLPQSADRFTEGVILFRLATPSGGTNRGTRVAAKIHTFPNGDKLLVARDIGEFTRRFARFRLLSFLSIACMLLVILVSFLISHFVVSRINRMSDTALEIMDTGDLSRRLEIDSRWDDLSHLAGVLNQMLERIEDLLAGVRQVSDNIAHDLRTPLTRLRNRLEEMRQESASAEGMEDLIADADQILGTFQSLLRISRMDAGKERHHFTRVDTARVLCDVVELYQPVAQEQGIDIRVNHGKVSPVQADRNLLFQALVNVLDNALKYGGQGKLIECAIEELKGEGVEIRVEDRGPGIAESEREKVLERFYRGDSSRSTRGSGLGLSMVAAILRLHRGRITLGQAQPNGLQVVLFLPFQQTNINNS